MLFRSLRFRLTFWYALSLAVIMAASGTLWHWYLGNELHDHLDERLKIIAEDVVAFQSLTHEGDLLHHKPEPDHCRNLEEFLRRHNWGEYVQVRTRHGEIACFSSNLQKDHLPLTREGRQTLEERIPVFENLKGSPFTGNRMLTVPIFMDRKLAGVVQVASDTSAVDKALDHLRIILLTFSPLALLAITLGGWFLAGRALAPVTRITRSMHRINAENLYQRLPVSETMDEISTLAETFNAMLARLEDSFRRIKQFSGDASHELRTPLTILKGETEVALRWAKTPEEFQKMLVSNMEEINRMERIIEDLLMLAKSEAGELPMEKKPLSLSDLLQELYLAGRALAEGRQILVLLKIGVDEEITIQGDELRLRQMFLNLISNAVKYTPAPGKVEISLRVDGDDAVIVVADTGIGIPARHLPHIFDRFYRIDEARNREAGGAGLGLAIVKWIVDAHEGKIEIASTPGQGSEFVVRLPLVGPSHIHRNAISA